jgi:hypothetical protein
MTDILYDAAAHYQRGRELAAAGDIQGAIRAYHQALLDLHAVRPQRRRDVLLARVYLDCHVASRELDPDAALRDLRAGYSYARTTHEPSVRLLAEQLWRNHLQRAAGQLVE